MDEANEVLTPPNTPGPAHYELQKAHLRNLTTVIASRSSAKVVENKSNVVSSAVASPRTSDNDKSTRHLVAVIFFALLVDIISFSLMLPLLPRLMEYYKLREPPNSLFSRGVAAMHAYKQVIFGSMDPATHLADQVERDAAAGRLDALAYGGLSASLFALLQCAVAPFIGRASDYFGRRKVLLYWCMLGNIISCALWAFATRFPMFVWSRVVGGLCEGNVQLSVSVITDAVPASKRAGALAVIGAAVALGFTFGPAIGASLATYTANSVNPYFAPATLALILVVMETLALYVWLPETKKNHKQNSTESRDSLDKVNLKKKIQLQMVFLGYLFLYGGLEFTIPFFMFTNFKYTNAQQGTMFAVLGLLAACVQGGYTRRTAKSAISEARIARQGVISCSLSFFALAWSGNLAGARSYYAALVAGVLMSFAGGTTVTGLRSIAARLAKRQQVNSTDKVSEKTTGDDKGDQEDEGATMGVFRAWGQLGRATGPLVLGWAYWVFGPVHTFSLAGAAALALAFACRGVAE